MSTETQQKYTLFYSAYSPFSNWHPCQFEMDGVRFNCAEQAMMYLKALLFKDQGSADKIMAAKAPREQKALGRMVNGFDQTVWEQNRDKIMDDILMAKFSQNDNLKAALLATGQTKIVEASKFDRVWGIGLDETDPRALDESQWQGLNLLGRSLDRVRETLLTS